MPRAPRVPLTLLAVLTLSASCGTEELEVPNPSRARPFGNNRPVASPNPAASPDPAASPAPNPADVPPAVPTTCPKRLVSRTTLTALAHVQAFELGEQLQPQPQRFVVPAGVTAVAVKLWAGGGGTCGPTAGGGGYVSVPSLPVVPGETLEIVVGGGGVCRARSSPGGFGGGGRGSDEPTYAWSGSGGGRSALLRGGDDVVTAGGGGGTGYAVIYSEGNRPNGPGGDGCAAACGAGGDSAARAGGQGGQLDRGGDPGTSVDDGHPGSARTGGDGLSITEGFVTSGGGGGGYFGGGSGGHDVHVASGGGGGGSCFVAPGGSYDGANSGAPGGLGDPDYVEGVGRGGDVMRRDGQPGRVIIGW
jgi:hypothetical protein